MVRGKTKTENSNFDQNDITLYSIDSNLITTKGSICYHHAFKGDHSYVLYIMYIKGYVYGTDNLTHTSIIIKIFILILYAWPIITQFTSDYS